MKENCTHGIDDVAEIIRIVLLRILSGNTQKSV